jgi:hypothetical protein
MSIEITKLNMFVFKKGILYIKVLTSAEETLLNEAIEMDGESFDDIIRNKGYFCNVDVIENEKAEFYI